MGWLVVGVGNELRRDDGLGPWLAEAIAAWALPGVEVRTARQLTPELAEDVGRHDGVLFLDADRLHDAPTVLRVAANSGEARLGHAMIPSEIVDLARTLNGRETEAWVALVPGTDFGFGEGLSDSALRRGLEALVSVGELLREAGRCTKSAS